MDFELDNGLLFGYTIGLIISDGVYGIIVLSIIFLFFSIKQINLIKYTCAFFAGHVLEHTNDRINLIFVLYFVIAFGLRYRLMVEMNKICIKEYFKLWSHCDVSIKYNMWDRIDVYVDQQTNNLTKNDLMIQIETNVRSMVIKQFGKYLFWDIFYHAYPINIIIIDKSN